MAKIQCSDITRELKDLFSDAVIRDLAQASGFVQRERKLDVVAFFWTLVLGFGLKQSRTIAGLRCSYATATGETFAPSAFYDRFNERLLDMLKEALKIGLESFSIGWGCTDEIAQAFTDVLLTDSSVIKLHDSLRHVFPGCRTNCAPAAAKLHAVVSVKGKGKSTVALSAGRVHDSKKLTIGSWVRDNLLMFDLGYFGYKLFTRIAEEHGYFLSRMKLNANPLLVSNLGAQGPGAIPVEGEYLQDILKSIRRDVLDVQAKVLFRRRGYNGHQSAGTSSFRVVAVRDKTTGEYHTYITNIPPEMLDAQAVAACYRARWLVELLFKELKGGYRLDQIPSRRREIVESLLYAALLTLVTSRRLFQLLATQDRARRYTPGRWWSLFAANAHTILLAVLHPRLAETLLKNLLATLRHELGDPHRARVPLLFETLECYAPKSTTSRRQPMVKRA